jgi:hypothetical protein
MSHIDLEPGAQLGDFRIEGRLGVGGMGIVYRARQLSLNRAVALKVFDGSSAHPKEIARFRRAAQAAARLQHPNIATIHAVGEENGICYLAMEQIDGASFQQVVPRLAAVPVGVQLRLPATGSESAGFCLITNFEVGTPKAAATADAASPDSDLPFLDLVSLALDGPPKRPGAATVKDDTSDVPTTDLPGVIGPGPDLSIAAGFLLMQQHYHRLCCAWIRDAARGVQYAHENGIIHRDLKPGNLMLSRDGRVRVIDFGLARCFDDETLTSTGQLLGTPLYMSPEQVTGRIELSAKTDIYSLGLVLFELLTLGSPITARNREELFQRILAKPLEPVTHVNPSVGTAIEAVVHKATAKDPDERYETAGAFADDLERVLAGNAVTAPAYKPRDDEAEILNSRPALIPGIVAQFYVGAIAWGGYGVFLLTAKDAPGRDRVPLPFLSLGWLGVALAWAIAHVLYLAAMRIWKGYRWGYYAGLIGQLVLMASTLLFMDTMNRLRPIESDRELLWWVLWGAILLLWQVRQLWQYFRRPVRAWFDFVQKWRQARSPASWFRGRSIRLQQ